MKNIKHFSTPFTAAILCAAFLATIILCLHSFAGTAQAVNAPEELFDSIAMDVVGETASADASTDIAESSGPEALFGDNTLSDLSDDNADDMVWHAIRIQTLAVVFLIIGINTFLPCLVMIIVGAIGSKRIMIVGLVALIVLIALCVWFAAFGWTWLTDSFQNWITSLADLMA